MRICDVRTQLFNLAYLTIVKLGQMSKCAVQKTYKKIKNCQNVKIILWGEKNWSCAERKKSLKTSKEKNDGDI